MATYLGVHLYYLGGAPGHRVKVLSDWLGARTGNLGSQVIEGQLSSVERSPQSVEPVQ
jgi:hypothetical protein